MRTSYRVVSAALIVGLVLSACGGHGSTPPIAGAQANSVVSAPESVANAQIGAVPHPSGDLAVNDLGRRAASAPVHVSITLAYNHQAQLDALVKAQADPTSPMYHQFLTTDQFNAYYAPTVQQEESVVDSLRAAGFTVTQRFANRTIVDATAPSSTVEKYFNTEIHNVSQGKFGTRYMNARNPVLPPSIASLVRDVSLNDIIVAKTRANPHRSINVTTTKHQQKGSNHDVRSANRVIATTCTGQLLLNPGFESGTLDWNDPNGDIYNYYPYAYQGNYFAWIDGYSSPVTDPGVSQTVNIPAGCTATLSYYLFVGSNEPATPTDYFYVTVNGHTVQTYNNTTNTGGTYAHTSVNVSAYAGQSATIKFYAVQNGYNTTNFFVDNTALTLSGGTSTPTPSPKPTATPTPKPTATPSPTPAPTATPVHTPTPAPTATPTVAPTATPTPVPTATPTPSSNCNGAAALNGPLSGSYGHFPTGVAKAFDFPTQHGCTGAGQTIAIMIDTPITASDVSTFLSSAGITQTGSITNVAVDGGGTTATSDYVETALDVETVSGLAPAANIRVYNFPNLTDQSIEDGYNQAVSDGIASVVNSSFGGCESGDTPFANTTNSIAQQAAAKGMTFMASSGDSGSNECSGTQGVSAPAGGPYFVSVGAVDFTQNSTTGALSTITAGSDAGNGFQSGGGVSTVFALPSYQSGVANVITSGRNQPDISLPGVGVALYAASQGGWMTVDGTSWSSPEVTALMAETNQLHATKFGWVTPTLYSIFKSSSYTDFTDVTSGTNGGYNAVTGYDQVTGIGAPKGWALAQAI